MKKETEQNETIESYLNGTLGENAREAFAQQLTENPELAARVERQRQAHLVIREGALLQIRTELTGIHLKKVASTKRLRRISGFGAGGLILLTALWLLVRPHEIPGAFEIEEATSVPASESVITPGTSPEASAPLEGEQETSDTGGILTIVAVDTSASKPEPYIPPASERYTYMAVAVPDQTVPLPKSNPEQPIVVPEAKVIRETTTELNPCTGVKIQVVCTSQASCNTRNSGSITIDPGSVTGGIPPYTFSTDDKNYSAQTTFSALPPGIYKVFAKDGNGCKNLAGTVVVMTEDCSYASAFAPGRGELWEIPVEPDKEGSILIYNTSGILVYTTKLTSGESPVWNGSTSGGQSLPMGLYPFRIRYEDGAEFSGTVTLVR